MDDSKVERRSVERDFANWRAHVDSRLDAQDVLLRKIESHLEASKIGLAALRWLVAVGAGLAAIWGALHLPGPR